LPYQTIICGFCYEKSRNMEKRKKIKVVTTPCYMLDADIIEIEYGINKVVKSLIGLVA
jgi:enhancing lycopene biosynthesis protein 2